MSYIDDCNHRESIMNKIYKGNRITNEERLWLTTHPLYNKCYQEPYYNVDIIHLDEKTEYCINVNVKRITCDEKMIPVIGVATGKGKLIIDGELLDLDGNVTATKETKILGVNVDLNNTNSKFTFYSELGLLSVSYQCEYLSKDMGMYRKETSSSGILCLAMKKVVLADNKVEYHCKSPLNDDFDSLVFTLEWISC